MKYFSKLELIRCFREDKNERCKECRLTQAAMTLPNGAEENIEALVSAVLDPAREALGKPIVVTSGFRCMVHNTAVGSKPTSQHIRGMAADLTAGSPEDNLKLARIIVKNGNYDQLIAYLNADGSMKPRFLHVSWKKRGGNRHEVRKHLTGWNSYPLLTAEEMKLLK